MDLGGWDDERQIGAAPVRFAKAGDGRSYIEQSFDMVRPDSVIDLASDRDNARQKFADAINAADRGALYDSNLVSRRAAREDAYDEAIGRIERLTGQRLNNPLKGGYLDEALGALAEDPNYKTARRSGRPVGHMAEATAERIFQDRLEALRRDNRDVAGDLVFNPTLGARGLADRANADQEKAGASLPWLARNTAALIGGITGQRRDPLFWGSLVVGPASASAKTVAGRIAQSALTQGAFNAGLSALAQPSVQAWRRDRGADSGLLPALEEIGFAFLAGAVPGAGIQGGIEAFNKLKPSLARIFNGTASVREARETLAALDPAAARNQADILDQAERAAEADQILEAERPTGVSAVAHDDAIRQAARHLEDPEAMPAPETARPLPPARPEEAPLSDAAPMIETGQTIKIQGMPATFERVDARALGTDAATFQYKSNSDGAGVSDRLQGVKRWDPIAASKAIVYEFADGRRVIADGHQRLGLAKRLIAEGREPAITLDAFVFREADGWRPADIRALAAKKNMQEGSGSALDAARILREWPQLLDGSLPTNAGMMRAAVNLSRLSNEAFGMVVNGRVPEPYAAAVGALAPNKATHAGIMDELARAAPETEREARLLITDALAAGFRLEEQVDLFGQSQMARSLIAERAKVLSAVLGQLRESKKVFGVLASRADVIEAAGNALDRAGNAARAATADTIGELLVRLAQRTGPLSDRLNRAAAALAEGEMRAPAAARQFLDDVQKVLEESGLKGLMESPRLKPATVAEPGTVEAEQAVGVAASSERATGERAAADARSSTRAPTLEDFISGQKGVDVDTLHARAVAFQGELVPVGAEIAKETGARMVNPGVKDLATARDKIARKGYEDASSLTDLARMGFVVGTPAEADDVARRLAAAFDQVDEGWKPQKSGYIDRKILVRRDDGTVGEVQIIPDAIYEIKSRDQDYNIVRAAPDSTNGKAAFARMQAAYAAAALDAFEGIFARSSGPKLTSNVQRQSSSDISPAVSNTSAKSTSTQGPSFLSTAKADSGNTTAGRQSQLTKSMSDPPDMTISAVLPRRNVGAEPAEPTLFDRVPVVDELTGAPTTRALDQALEAADRGDLLADLTDACKV